MDMRQSTQGAHPRQALGDAGWFDGAGGVAGLGCVGRGERLYPSRRWRLAGAL